MAEKDENKFLKFPVNLSKTSTETYTIKCQAFSNDEIIRGRIFVYAAKPTALFS